MTSFPSGGRPVGVRCRSIRGLPYQTSATNFEFLTPSLLSSIESRNLSCSTAFWVPNPPSRVGTSYINGSPLTRTRTMDGCHFESFAFIRKRGFHIRRLQNFGTSRTFWGCGSCLFTPPINGRIILWMSAKFYHFLTPSFPYHTCGRHKWNAPISN